MAGAVAREETLFEGPSRMDELGTRAQGNIGSGSDVLPRPARDMRQTGTRDEDRMDES